MLNIIILNMKEGQYNSPYILTTIYYYYNIIIIMLWKQLKFMK